MLDGELNAGHASVEALCRYLSGADNNQIKYYIKSALNTSICSVYVITASLNDNYVSL